MELHEKPKMWRRGLQASKVDGRGLGRATSWVCIVAIAEILLGGTSLAATKAPQTFAHYRVPSGVEISPTASTGSIIQHLPVRVAPGDIVEAGQAAAVALSPDGTLLAVVTNGYNVFHVGVPSRTITGDYVFLFDPRRDGVPRLLQVLPVGSAFLGLKWTPRGDRLLVSGGADDVLLEYRRKGMSIRLDKEIHLGHATWAGRECPQSWPKSICSPQVGAIDVSPDGKRALIANIQNDSVSLLDIATGRILSEADLRPGKVNPTDAGKPGGSFPRDVVWVGQDRAFVTSTRDREIVVLSVGGASLEVSARLATPGQPTAMIASAPSRRAYVALESTSQIAVVDTEQYKIAEIVDVAAPRAIFDNVHRLGGAIPNSLALSRDSRSLFVTNAGENAIAVVALGDQAQGRAGARLSKVVGLVPTGWYPTGIALSNDGKRWYVSNLKSATGPGVPRCGALHKEGLTCLPPTFAPGAKERPDSDAFNLLVRQNISVNQQEKGALLTIPAPSIAQLARLTNIVARNNHFKSDSRTSWPPQLLNFLRAHIKHVVFILKANKSYDVVLGDVPTGDGDPGLAWFPAKITPNEHKIVSQFVLLDNFRDSSGVGWTGWDWSLGGRTTDLKEREEPISMLGHAFADTSGNRVLNMGYATNGERRQEDSGAPRDPDVLPGSRDVFELDGPDGRMGEGYIWNSIIRAGKTVRDWGTFPSSAAGIFDDVPKMRNPYASRSVVFRGQKAALRPLADPFYHYPWDLSFPDIWRFEEWNREFEQFVADGVAPNLMMMWLCDDQGEWAKESIAGVEAPFGTMGDNDYAFGEVVAAIANSPFAKDTLIFSIEDSSRDGGDHVDVHRSTMYIAGPYVRQGITVSTYYTSVDVVRTIEDILEASPNSIGETFAHPMIDLFDETKAEWRYEAIVPDSLKSAGVLAPAR